MGGQSGEGPVLARSSAADNRLAARRADQIASLKPFATRNTTFFDALLALIWISSHSKNYHELPLIANPGLILNKFDMMPVLLLCQAAMDSVVRGDVANP